MIKKDWSVLINVSIATILLIAATQWQAPQCFSFLEETPSKKTALETRSTDYDASAQESIDWANAILKQGIPAMPCPNPAESCTEAYHNALDLKAQWATAEAAARMVCMTVLQIFIGALGFLALLYSLYLTRKSLKHSEQSAEAAQHAVQIAAETARKDLRAYVGVNEINWELDGDWQQDNGSLPTIKIKYENYGETPAFKLEAFLDYIISKNEEVAGFSLPNKTKSSTVLMPGQEHYLGKFLSAQPWGIYSKYIINGSMHLFAFGRIEYEDTYGEKRFSNFRARLMVDAQGIMKAQFVLCAEGNDAE